MTIQYMTSGNSNGELFVNCAQRLYGEVEKCHFEFEVLSLSRTLLCPFLLLRDLAPDLSGVNWQVNTQLRPPCICA